MPDEGSDPEPPPGPSFPEPECRPSGAGPKRSGFVGRVRRSTWALASESRPRSCPTFQRGPMRTDRKRIPPPFEAPLPDPFGEERSRAATAHPTPERGNPLLSRRGLRLSPQTTAGPLPKPVPPPEARGRAGWVSLSGGSAVRPGQDLQPDPSETTPPWTFESQTRIGTDPDETGGRSREPASKEDSASPVKNGLHGNSWKACTLRLSPSRTSLPSGAA